jgi:peptidoglycan/LPS O-acetylase OafA/YrhL
MFPVLRSLPVSSVLNGSLAVNVFFVLSGFVLTRPGWGKPDKTIIVQQIVKRYLRLMPAVVALVLLVWVMMALGFNRNAEAGAIVGRPEWLGHWLNFDPDLGGALHYGFMGVFLGNVPHDYDPFLWVLPNELWGGLLVLGICGLERFIPFRYATLAVATVLSFLYVPVLFCFLVGADLALLHADGHLEPWQDRGWVNVAALIVFWCGGAFLALGSFANYTPLVATLCVVLAMRAPWLRRGFEAGVSQFLGRISFPLYLVQFIVLVGPSSGAIIAAQKAGVLNFGVCLMIALGSIAASLLAAVAFMPVERLTLAIARAAGRQIRPQGFAGRESAANAPSPAP